MKKHEQTEENPPLQPKLKWEKINEDQTRNYTWLLNHAVSSTMSPIGLLQCQNTCRCRNSECQKAIQQEYDFLVKSFKEADRCLPRFKPGVEKDWWTATLSNLRQKSIEITNLWKNEGCLRHGPTNAERLKVKAEYKRAIRAAQRAPKQAAWDRLHSSLADKDTNTFWKSWRSIYNKNGCHLAPVVNGCSTKKPLQIHS